MRLGVIGAGRLAQAVAGLVVASGHTVVLSNSRGPSSLSSVTGRLGPCVFAGTTIQAAAEETVVLAVPSKAVPAAVQGLPEWGGRTLVDATNDLHGYALLPGVLSSSEIVAEMVPGAHVVKAFNTLPAALLASAPSPGPGVHRVQFVCGDDVPSKCTFRGFLEDLGFSTVDLGGLAEGSRLQQIPGGALAALNLLHVL